MKKDNITKFTFLCFIYYLALLLVNSIIKERIYLAQGSVTAIQSNLIFSLNLEILIPCVVFFIWGIKKHGFIAYITNIVRYVAEHKVAYLGILLVLLFLQWNFEEGFYHIYGRVPGCAIDLPPSTSSRIIIFVYHYMFEERITVAFSLLAPLIIKMTTTAPASYTNNLDRQAQ